MLAHRLTAQDVRAALQPPNTPTMTQVGSKAHTTSHADSHSSGRTRWSSGGLAWLCLSANKRGDQVPHFSLKIDLQLLRWASTVRRGLCRPA